MFRKRFEFDSNLIRNLCFCETYPVFYFGFFYTFCFVLCFFQEPSLFAVAKLLETGLVNMDRIEILWRPLTGHLLEVMTT